jgi:hypothetical protein
MVALVKRKQDEFQAFYTNCNDITSYMIGLLQCHGEMSVLEPCAGEGVFIDELRGTDHAPHITAYELNSNSVEILRDKYSGISRIKIEQEDFLLMIPLKREKFDRIIANPPYGAYQSPDKRKQLKRDYPYIYAKETYGLFLIRAMELLKESGRLVFIVPDTYLTLHMHEGLRKEILKNYQIESITLFPSNFFPGVNFGYAGLSIISIINKTPSDNYEFPVYNRLETPAELHNLLNIEQRKKHEICRLSYDQLITNPSSAFFLPSKNGIFSVISSETVKIGDICSVVTGFYSGNDGKYLRRSAFVTRGAKKYATVNENEICIDDLSICPPLNGISNLSHWVPIVKGGNKRFYKNSEWFMDWSKKAIHDYKVENKKQARFQNSQHYFRHGIAVPMVSSSSITGSLIDGRLFDQSIVGIFPHEKYKYLTYFLLGFFNSKVCNDLIRTINASTNNSSNYIKKIPIIIPKDKVVQKMTDEVKRLLLLSKQGNVVDDDLIKMNGYFDEIYGVKNA